MFNTAMFHLGCLTLACLGWFLGMLVYEFTKDGVYTLYWKRRAKTLSHKLYAHEVTMMVIPVDSSKFMISFKCEGYEDWIFYITAKSWKEIGAVACQRWDDYLAERERVIELADADDVDLDELFGESDGLPVEYCGDGIYKAQLQSDDRPATDDRPLTKEYVEDLEKRFAEKGIMPMTLAGKSCVSTATDGMKAMADAVKAYVENCGSNSDSVHLSKGTDGGEDLDGETGQTEEELD